MMQYIIPDFIKDYISKCTQINPHSNNGRLNGKRLKLYLTLEIQEWQSQNNNIPFTIVKKMILTGNYNHPVCETCGKVLPIEKYGTRFCCNACLGKSKDIKEKRQETWKERTGCDNPQKSKEVQEKTRQTNLKKYGVEYPNQSEKVIEKRKQTNLKKYCELSYTKTQEYKDKCQKTCQEKYGCDYTGTS